MYLFIHINEMFTFTGKTNKYGWAKIFEEGKMVVVYERFTVGSYNIKTEEAWFLQDFEEANEP